MTRKLIVLCAGLLAALTVAAGPAAADPTNNPNAPRFTVTCPGMDPFQVTVAGAIGFVQGSRQLALRQSSADPPGSLETVTCTADNEFVDPFTVYLTFIGRS